MSRGELDSLKEQRVKLERDKGILRTTYQEISSLSQQDSRLHS
jgi:hypothetical protein